MRVGRRENWRLDRPLFFSTWWLWMSWGCEAILVKIVEAMNKKKRKTNTRISSVYNKRTESRRYILMYHLLAALLRVLMSFTFVGALLEQVKNNFVPISNSFRLFASCGWSSSQFRNCQTASCISSSTYPKLITNLVTFSCTKIVLFEILLGN